jgi:histidinol-phosphate/aromatic aminotransferase/cobyric acid decarboxylase-like protein
VIYLGTFSKMLFPAIRLGFLVVPRHLAARFSRARIVVDLQPSIFAQPALARFIAQGHLATHVRRTRRVYRHDRTRCSRHSPLTPKRSSPVVPIRPACISLRTSPSRWRSVTTM